MATKTAVIGLCGKKRSGKDTVHQILKDKFKCVRRIAFADALKQELAEALKLPVGFIEERKDVFRLGLQWYGSEYRRGLYGDNYWIDKAREVYNRSLDWQPDIVVFTDCRFPNEVALIKELGGLLWRVNRPGAGDPRDQHVSETALDRTLSDREIENEGTLSQLKALVLRSVREDFGDYHPGGGFV